MIINLKNMPSTKIFDLSLPKEWWQAREDDPVLGLDKPLKVDAELYRAGKRFILKGKLSGGVLITCDRCLEAYNRDIVYGFNVSLVRPTSDPENMEVELIEEDMSVAFVNEEEIDLDDIIREQVYLALPIKYLCNDNCMGLCPECGMNLNMNKCQCMKKHGHPGFLKLKNLKI